GKTVENRTWATRHCGPLLIHAAKSLASLHAQNPTYWRRVLGVELPREESLPFGYIVGVVNVVGCVLIEEGGRIGPFGQSVWAMPGYYGWILENPRTLATPIP